MVSSVLKMWCTRYENNPGPPILEGFLKFSIGKKISSLILFVPKLRTVLAFMDMVQELSLSDVWSFFYIATVCVIETVAMGWFRFALTYPSFLQEPHHLMYIKKITPA